MATPTTHDYLFCDVERELAVTRKVLERLPIADHFNYKPHAKSMSLGQLALHVATIPEWADHSLGLDVLNFKDAPRPPQHVANTAELLKLFDDRAEHLRKTVASFDASRWNSDWTMKDGEKVFTTQPKWKAYRVWSLNHMIHHRAQLCLYLRLLNVPVPAVYFNSADEPAFVFE